MKISRKFKNNIKNKSELTNGCCVIFFREKTNKIREYFFIERNVN